MPDSDAEKDYKPVEWYCQGHRLTTRGNPCCVRAQAVAWEKPRAEERRD